MWPLQAHGGLKIVFHPWFHHCWRPLDPSAHACMAETTLRAVWVVCRTCFCLRVKRLQTVNWNCTVWQSCLRLAIEIAPTRQELADIYSSAICCHSNETRAPIANPPNSAQLEGTPYHSSNLHPGPCSSVGMRRGTDRQTHGRDHYTFRLGYTSREMWQL